MKRFVVLLVVVVASALVSVRQSRADEPVVVQCTVLPNGSPTYCVATPSTVGPAQHNYQPDKSVSIGRPITAPDGIVEYPLGVTSRFLCFSLNEPIDLSLLGSPSAGMFVPISPADNPLSVGSERIHVAADTGTASLLLEVSSSAASLLGLDLKARWPDENIERVSNIVSPATPAPTATLPPGAGLSAPTATSTPIPTATGTPAPTSTPLPTSTAPALPFAVSACIQPDILQGSSTKAGRGSGTLFGLTTPGAVCTPGMTFYRVPDLSDYTTAGLATPPHPDTKSFDTSPQAAASDQIAAFPFSESTNGDFAIGTVTCSLPDQPTLTACTSTLIAQSDTLDYLNGLSASQRRSLRQTVERAFCPAGSAHL